MALFTCAPRTWVLDFLGALTTKVAVTLCEVLMLTVQVPDPVQSPLQALKANPVNGVAVRINVGLVV